MNRTGRFLGLLLIAVFMSPGAAIKAASAPDNVSSATQILELQARVDELWDRGEFARAYFIYRNELVPLGDKYAQYMVGYMHLTGMGTEKDPVLASAWYRLAAESGTSEFVMLRDLLMAEIPDALIERADMHYRTLHLEYSDLAVLLKSVKRHYETLQDGPGLSSQLPSRSVFRVTTSDGFTDPAADYYSRIRDELIDQLRKIADIGNLPDLETDPAKVDLDEVERLVNERIAATGP